MNVFILLDIFHFKTKMYLITTFKFQTVNKIVRFDMLPSQLLSVNEHHHTLQKAKCISGILLH